MSEPRNELTITARFDDQASEGINRLVADINSLAGAGRTIEGVEAGMTRAAAEAQVFREQYAIAMNGLARDVEAAFARLIEGGYMALARATAMLVAGQQGAARAFGRAMLEMSAQAILAVGRQAAVKAIFALAEGLLFRDPTAFAAARLYGMVAGMALVVGGSMMAGAASMNAHTGAGGGGHYSGGGGGYGGAASQPEAQPNIVVNVNVEGHVVDTRAFVEEHVAPALAEAVGKGVAGSGQYNLVVRRD